MNHQTISGFRRDDTVRQRKFNRAVARRALGYALPVPHGADRFHRRGHPGRDHCGDPAPAVPQPHRHRRPRQEPRPRRLSRAGGGRARLRQRDALAGAAVVLGEDRRRTHLRLARPAVRSRAADAARVLHPRADRRAADPAQLRRHRRAASGDEHARHRLVEHHRHRGDADDHVRARLAADDLDVARAARVHMARAPARTATADAHPRGHAAERRDEQPHRGTVQRRGCARRQALRSAGIGSRRVRRSRRAACATSASAPRCTDACCSSRSDSSRRWAPRSST